MDISIKKKVIIDLKKQSGKVTLSPFIQHDNNIIQLEILNGNEFPNFTSPTSFIVNFKRSDGEVFSSVQTPVDNVIEYKLTTNDMEELGEFELTLQVFEGDNRVTSFVIQGKITKTLSANFDYEETEYKPIVQQLLDTNASIKSDLTGIGTDLESANTKLEQNEHKTNSITINVKFPPFPLVGAVGDGVTDDTIAIRKIIAYADTLEGYPSITFPNSIAYRVTDTIVVPREINVIMNSHLLFDGSNDKPCLVIGSDNAINSNVNLSLSVRNKNQSNWNDENNIGIKLINTRNSFIKLTESHSFTIGVQCMASSNGFAWNHVTVGRMLNNKYSLDITNENKNGNVGWANENLFFSGSFVNQGSVNTSHDRYGVRINSLTNDYYNNSNHFIKPDFELSSVTGKVSIPFLILYGGHSVFEKCRKESLTTVFAVIRNDSGFNSFHLGYSDTDCTIQDESATPTSTIAQQRYLLEEKSMKTIFSSGNLGEQSCYYNVGRVNLKSCHFGNIYDSTVYKYSPNSNTITPFKDYIEIGNYDGVGIFLNTEKVKRFVISPSIVGNTSGRLYIICYDESGNILTGNVLKSSYSSRFQFISNNFGGAFKTVSDTSFDETVIVSQEVKKIRVLYGKGSNNLKLSSFSIYSLERGGAGYSLGYEKIDYNYATQIPTAGEWEKGKRLVNANPTVGQPKAWICTVSGSPGTWVSEGNL